MKKFIHCSKTAWHNDKSIRILDKQGLADKKVVECYRFMQVGIFFLLVWQYNVATNRVATIFKCSAVGSFHNARASTCHSTKAKLCYALSKLAGCFIIRMIFFIAG